jgi:hypothetical protein
MVNLSIKGTNVQRHFGVGCRIIFLIPPWVHILAGFDHTISAGRDDTHKTRASEEGFVSYEFTKQGCNLVQGCQIFLGTIYQNGKKMYQMTPKIYK